VNAVARFRHTVSEYPRMLWLLAMGSFLNAVGLAFLWPINSIYIHEQLGKPLTVAGIVLLLNSGGAMVGNLTGGALFDRLGARPVLLTGLFAAALTIALPAVFDSWPLYVAVMILFGFAIALAFPAMNALAAKVWPAGGRRAFNFLYVANNVGVAVGTAVGGLVASYSFKLAFALAAAAICLYGIFAWAFIQDKNDPAPALVSEDGERPIPADSPELPVPWAPIIALFVALFLLWLVYCQWASAVAVHMQDLGFNLASYSILWTLNGVLIFAGQPVIAMVVKRLRTLSAQMLLGTVLLAVAFGSLLVSGGYAAFVVSMVVLTFGEMLLWPTIPAAVARLSPPSRRGFLQGFISSAATFGRMLGPLFGGLLYDHVPFSVLLTVMVSLLVLPLLSITVYARTRTGREMVAAGDD
jgi:predicted MFS family arabinose efflux permease